MKKTVSLGVGAALLTLSLAACGSGNGNDEAQNTPSASGSASASPSASADNGKPVTITFMHFKSDFTDGVAKIVEQFESENPNIKVDVQPVKYDDYYTLLKTKLAGGDVVDVFTLNAGAQTKLFSDGGYLEELTGKPFLADFDESVLKAQSTDGKNFILPLNANPIAVFYNKKMFGDLGIQIPRTYDAMIAAAQKIKEAGKTPFALGWKDPWTLSMWLTRDMPSNSALVFNQPDFFEKLETGSAKFADNPATKVMLEHAQQLFDLGNKDQLGVDYNGAVDLFAKGDVGMMYMGTWPLADIQKKNPELYDNMGYFPYPFSNDESLNKLEFNPDASLAISSKSSHKEAAEKFLTFLASKEGGDLVVKNINTLSYVKGTDTNIAPAVNDLKPYFDKGEMYDSQLYLAKTTIDWGTPFTQAMQKMFFKKSTIDQAIQEMDAWVAKNHN
ncbi:ABC transporter substrate-binding protein [Cohnella nanjingensis]|uniref:Extracellular solute-binding protein n=1 Tax=Cohnella nanjingensis TaxID=1387779 RepID=A0A7X0RKF0_9BACL|nr:extracellular solute-binding protein [Cohnella nanjingensis]MBB6669117.1 extracellular solute-binding protein [Cohnella nanjingensis]